MAAFGCSNAQCTAAMGHIRRRDVPRPTAALSSTAEPRSRIVLKIGRRITDLLSRGLRAVGKIVSNRERRVVVTERVILGIYLIGSLAHGGFGVRYSDIDVALIVEQPLSAAKLDSMRRTQRKAAQGDDLICGYPDG
jgi:hypothetical protein